MFSVVTISRDRPSIYRNHLLSLQNQKMPNGEPWELIILDDSTKGNDEQEEVIKEVCSQGMPCKTKAFRALNRIELGGEGKTINYGVKRTSGDSLFVICGDDIFPSHHFFLIHRVWQRWIDAGRENFVLSWPLYHMKPETFIKPELLQHIDYIDSMPEVAHDILQRREDVHPDFAPGLDVFYGVVDDRALYPSEFLFDIKGWWEGAGSWWRDAWMWGMLSFYGYDGTCEWSSWSLHQWHPLWDVKDNAIAKEHLDEYSGKVDVSNEGEWGEAEMREIII